MNLAGLISELHRLGLNIEDFVLKNAELTVDFLAISRHPFGVDWPEGKWCVYFNTSDQRFDVSVFDTESTACETFLARMLKRLQLKHQYGRMTRKELMIELEKNNIQPAWYLIDGSTDIGDELVLSQIENGEWIVFKAERGAMQNEAIFRSESDACIHFLDRIVTQAELLKRHRRGISSGPN